MYLLQSFNPLLTFLQETFCVRCCFVQNRLRQEKVFELQTDLCSTDFHV